MVELPYEMDFKESQIPTKARPIQINTRHCQKEIKHLLEKGLIRKSYSPWSCPAFYVENAAEKERGVPRLGNQLQTFKQGPTMDKISNSK